MEIGPVVSILTKVAVRVEARSPGSRWYVFGSLAKGGARIPADVDILIVYQAEPDRKVLRESLREVSFDFPLHLVLMLKSEESQTQFIDKQGAILIYP
jgi:predicted nucleotidyltransferase